MDCLLGNALGTTKFFRTHLKDEKWLCEVTRNANCDDSNEGTLAGVRFRQDFDDSGWVQATTDQPPYTGPKAGSWTIYSKFDAMNLRKLCSAYLDDLFLAADPADRVVVSVMPSSLRKV